MDGSHPPPAIRKVIYTTSAIESINAQLRKIIKTRGHFPNDEAATKLIWLGLRNITANWGSAAHEWKSAMNQFAILYGDRFIGLAGKARQAVIGPHTKNLTVPQETSTTHRNTPLLYFSGVKKPFAENASANGQKIS